MTTPLQGLRTVIYSVADVESAREWWTALLGHAPYFDQPFYVGYNVAGFELGLVPSSDDAGTSLTYWGVEDVIDAMNDAVSAGAVVHEPASDVGEGIVTGAVRSPQGSLVGFIRNPHFALPG